MLTVEVSVTVDVRVLDVAVVLSVDDVTEIVVEVSVNVCVFDVLVLNVDETL